MSNVEELKNGEWIEAEPIKYEHFALIKDVFTFIKRLLRRKKE